MLKRSYSRLAGALLCVGSSVAIGQTVYYQQDFEGASVPSVSPSPVWALEAATAQKIGPGDIFELVNTDRHSGGQSLRFSYDGANGICNMCGGNDVFQHAAYDSVANVVDGAGADLTSAPYLAGVGRWVYNWSNGFSKWRIVGVASERATNDKLLLELGAGSISGTASQFRGGDKVEVFRQCGVDGTVGGQVSRRSDCNRAIVYFTNVGTASQAPGASIFRRVYLKVEAGSVLPMYQKLRYWVTTTGPVYLSTRLDRGPGITISADANFVGGTDQDLPARMEPGVWYYFEEEFKAETSADANDGEYRLWFGKSGEEADTPAIDFKNLNLGAVTKVSLWGNQQHGEDSHGAWYVDDLKMSSQRVGPTRGALPQPTPSAPVGVTIE